MASTYRCRDRTFVGGQFGSNQCLAATKAVILEHDLWRGKKNHLPPTGLRSPKFRAWWEPSSCKHQPLGLNHMPALGRGGSNRSRYPGVWLAHGALGRCGDLPLHRRRGSPLTLAMSTAETAKQSLTNIPSIGHRGKYRPQGVNRWWQRLQTELRIGRGEIIKDPYDVC